MGDILAYTVNSVDGENVENVGCITAYLYERASVNVILFNKRFYNFDLPKKINDREYTNNSGTCTLKVYDDRLTVKSPEDGKVYEAYKKKGTYFISKVEQGESKNKAKVLQPDPYYGRPVLISGDYDVDIYGVNYNGSPVSFHFVNGKDKNGFEYKLNPHSIVMDVPYYYQCFYIDGY